MNTLLIRKIRDNHQSLKFDFFLYVGTTNSDFEMEGTFGRILFLWIGFANVPLCGNTTNAG